MTVNYSLSEVFHLAETIEKNGEAFYRRAAEAVDDAKTKEVFLDLAAKEKVHEQIFATLREQVCTLADQQIYDPDGQVEAYLRSVAETHVFNLDPDETALAASLQSPLSALKWAIGFEKDTIVYFSALKEAVPEESRAKVELLIREEYDHIRQLHQVIKELN